MKKAIFLTVIVLLALGVIVFDVATRSMTAFCGKKSQAVVALDADYKNSLRRVLIDGQPPQSVVSTANSDCIDGSDNVYVVATFSKAYPTAAIANRQVVTALHGNPASNVFFASTAGSAHLLSLHTSVVGANNKKYLIRYFFQDKIPCQTTAASSCNLQTALTDYDLLKQPIKIVQLSLVGTAQR